jgi:hypothetical protein
MEIQAQILLWKENWNYTIIKLEEGYWLKYNNQNIGRVETIADIIREVTWFDEVLSSKALSVARIKSEKLKLV